MSETNYDIAVLGGGPGGYVAAIRAAQLGMRAIVIEREALGGICLNWGCIPTKSLLRSAEVLETLRRAREFGLSSSRPTFDTAAVVARSREAARKLNEGVAFLLRKNGVAVLFGGGRILGVGSVEVSGKEGKRVVRASHVLVATGASPRVLSGLEGEGVWSYREAMVAEVLPKSMVIAGAGAIGVEFGYYYAAFGTKVMVVEAKERILPSEDGEVSEFLRRALEARGIEFRLGVRIAKIEKQGGGVRVLFSDGSEERCEVVLSALGVRGNVEGLGLEALGVVVEGGSIRVDGFGRTNVEGIYAIGDVVGAPMLAHKASHEGIVCIEAIAGESPRAIDRLHIPSCVYCQPQVASVGMSAETAEGRGMKVRVGKFPLSANGKAIAIGDTGGFVKTVFDAETGAFLGAQMVGPEVTEQVQGFGLALHMEATEEELMGSIFPHPTLSESMQESVLAAYGRAVHIPR